MPDLLTATRNWSINRARRQHPELSPRRWSNRELATYAPLFSGEVVNVSGWRDEDKEGHTYKSYFTGASSYAVTNYWGSSAANDGASDSLFLDLSADPSESLMGKFDVVFNHTVLEHIFDVPKAVSNMAGMTRDVMIMIVPFMQDEHYLPGLYGDFWRFTPLCVKELMERNGLSLMHLSSNNCPWFPIYLFAIGSRKPEKWAKHFPAPYDWEQRLGKSTFTYPGCAW
jgi:hypothetical protein